MKTKVLSLLLLLDLATASAFSQESPFYMPAATGDKISLYDNRLGQANMYGFGVEHSSTLFYKSASYYRWYLGVNADSGASDTMELAASKLTVNTKLQINADTLHTGNEFQSHGISIKAGSSARSIWMGYDSVSDIGYINAAKAGSHQPVVLQSRGGNVGVGTTTPDYKLDVKGTIRAEEVIVETGWSDFVFEPDYYLRPLSEVDSHIREFGHLPDVPSAETVESEGLSVGESQKIMMQKIEELTLYMIEKDKEVAELRQRIEQLETKNDVGTRTLYS